MRKRPSILSKRAGEGPPQPEGLVGESATLSLGLTASRSVRVINSLAPFIREKIKPQVTLLLCYSCRLRK